MLVGNNAKGTQNAVAGVLVGSVASSSNNTVTGINVGHGTKNAMSEMDMNLQNGHNTLTGVGVNHIEGNINQNTALLTVTGYNIYVVNCVAVPGEGVLV